jgi:hypothetical protein
LTQILRKVIVGILVLQFNTLDNREYLWIPFSAIVTLLIFTSFHQQIKLSSDILLNFALAFGFGFGFDKVFESWNKAPRVTKENKEPG